MPKNDLKDPDLKEEILRIDTGIRKRLFNVLD